MESNHCKPWDQIMAQIEYYFGDFNLSNDFFMKDIANKDNGWISIETLLKFKRLNALINNEKELLMKSVKNSDSNLIELSECESKIRRKLDKPLPELSSEYKQNLELRTVHIKGFPKDITLDEVMVWCKQFGEIVSVQMRKNRKNNDFNGCIFVIFANKSSADQLINQEVLKYKDQTLLKENRVRYHERKREFYEEKKRLRLEAKARLDEKMTVESENGIKTSDNDQEMKDEGSVDPIKVKLAVLKLTGLPRRLSFDKIKEFFSTYAKVSFVHKTNSKGFCFVRFCNELDAENVLAKTKVQSEDSGSTDKKIDKIVIDGNEAIAQVVTGEEEKQFWIETNESIAKFLKRKKNAKRVEKLVKRKQRKNRKRTSSDNELTNGSKQKKP